MKKRIISLSLALFMLIASLPVSAALPPNYKDIIDVPWQVYFKDKVTNFDKYENVHPRIWLDNDDFERIRGYAEGDMKKTWELVKKSADALVSGGPIKFYVSGENVWMNTQGKDLVNLVFAYKISNDKKYFEALIKFAEEICSYPSWSNAADGDNCHLAGNSSYLALGIFYDWCYDEISPELKKTIVDNIARRIEDFNYDASYGFDSINCHNMIIINTSALVGLSAMYEEIPKAETYIKRIAAKLATLTMEVMPDDGAAFEAVNYSSYSYQGLMQAGLVMRDLLNVDIINHPTMDAYAKFSVYSYLPVNGWESGYDVFGWGDGTETSNGTLIPVMSLMARERQNPVYKYFVEKRLDYAYNRGDIDYVYLYPLMFYDENLESKSPDEFKDNENGKLYYPLDFKTSDAGYVFLKDSWDGNEASIHFHCGPMLGDTAADFRKVWKGNTLGTGHNHPDMGALLLFAEGEWIFDDDGYITGTTTNHNTLTVNGIGQVSEAQSVIRRQNTDYGFTSWQAMIFAKPEIIEFKTYGDITYVACDITDVYPDYHYGSINVNMDSYIRHYIYLKPEKTVLIVDDVKTFYDSDLELRWHPTVQAASLQTDGSYIYQGKNAVMRLETFKDDGVEIINGMTSKVANKQGGIKDAFVLRAKKHGKKWVQPTAITWDNRNNGMPVNTSCKKEDGFVTFTVDDSVIKLDLKNNEILRNKTNSEINLKVDDNLIFLENEIISQNGTSYLNENELISLLNLEKKGDVISGNGKELTVSSLNNKPVIKDDENYIPVRELCEKLKIALWWDNDSESINIDTKADTSNADVFNLAICGQTALPDENGNYQIELFADEVIIDATPVSNGATSEVIYTETGFGENKVKVTSLDKTKVNEFTVTVNPVKTLGKYPVYNIASTATYSEIIALIDGNDETAWAVNGAGIEAIFDLGSVVDLNSVSMSLLHGAMRQQIFEISVSEDGENYVETFNGKASGTTMDFEKYEVGKKARYVKIIFGGHTNGGGWNNTKEIKFE